MELFRTRMPRFVQLCSRKKHSVSLLNTTQENGAAFFGHGMVNSTHFAAVKDECGATRCKLSSALVYGRVGGGRGRGGVDGWRGRGEA
jgi:hypothetical protein